MRVLVACEFSGRVRDAFLARGHDAMSCDLLPTESPGPHYQGDVRDVLDGGWDLMIADPPCTHLSYVSHGHWRNTPEEAAAAAFARLLMDAPIPRVAVENPLGILDHLIRHYDQIVQPYQFGDSYSKRTCLWLRNLPLLRPDALWVSPAMSLVGYHRRHSSKRIRAHLASVTAAGIARAMAEQWGCLPVLEVSK